MTAFFLIEDGKALTLVKEHISEFMRVREQSNAIAKELGITQAYFAKDSGVLSGVVFEGDVHPDFTKPKRGTSVSYPKRGTAWAEKFKAQIGYANQVSTISKAFGIPCSLGYKSDHGTGWCAIGSPLTECGFMFLSVDGPYGLWAPDVEKCVQDRITQGYSVEEPAASFKFNIDGARRIDREEWDLLVAQHRVNQKKKEKEQSNSK